MNWINRIVFRAKEAVEVLAAEWIRIYCAGRITRRNFRSRSARRCFSVRRCWTRIWTRWRFYARQLKSIFGRRALLCISWPRAICLSRDLLFIKFSNSFEMKLLRSRCRRLLIKIWLNFYLACWIEIRLKGKIENSLIFFFSF